MKLGSIYILKTQNKETNLNFTKRVWKKYTQFHNVLIPAVGRIKMATKFKQHKSNFLSSFGERAQMNKK